MGGVMKWLSGLLRKVGQFLVNSLRAFAILAKNLFGDDLKDSAVSFNAGVSPGIGFQINVHPFVNRDKWKAFKDFTDAMLGEIEKLVTAP